MGFDSNILKNETSPILYFKPGYINWLDRWKQPHNPKLWLANSCVWYSQIITKKLGIECFNKYIRLFDYGNKNTSGDKGMNNGLTNCWLSSSLRISPREQIDFMEKLVTNKLPVSLTAHQMTKNIMFIEDLTNGWKLYGKTGNGSQLDNNHNKIQDRQIGWFVGFVQKHETTITFAYLIVDDKNHKTYASLRAKLAFKNRISEFLKIYHKI